VICNDVFCHLDLSFVVHDVLSHGRIENTFRTSAWLFMEVLLRVNVGVRYWETLNWLSVKLPYDAGNNGPWSHIIERSLKAFGWD
jgi:hypothetical protein